MGASVGWLVGKASGKFVHMTHAAAAAAKCEIFLYFVHSRFLVFLRFCLHFDSAIFRSHKQNKGKRAEAQEKAEKSRRKTEPGGKVGKYIYISIHIYIGGNLMSCAAFEVASLR